MDTSYSDFLLAEKQIERFGPKPFSHFLLAEKQIERFGPNQFSHFLLAEKQIERYMSKVARQESSLLHART